MAEILAPAGGIEQLTAAVRCGANAVYLGAKGFNARRNAANFDENTLPQAVRYCHERGVNVYVTINTVVADDELDRLEEEADLVAVSGADAVIIQDMAVLRLFRSKYPGIKRFASTQTAVHNIDGARFLESEGFDSVVLARELTLDEMRMIREAVDVKLEAFVHGAHCMSVSGACYLSSMIGGRSGNRGLCAQPCRLDWNNGKNGYALSLKDMSLISHIREMVDAGVDSFKIEGRMKRPEYVAAAVTACRKALCGEPYDIDTLRAVFSRSGFSDGYLIGRRDASMFGARTKEDVTGAAGVLDELADLYRKETPLIGVDFNLSMTEGGSRLWATDGEHTAGVDGLVPQTAINRPTDRESAAKSLEKTGGTPFYMRSLNCSISDGLMLPASALNAMRREVLDNLLEQRGKLTPPMQKPFEFVHRASYCAKGAPQLWARFFTAHQADAADDIIAKIILPASEITPELIAKLGDRLVCELPAVLFPEDEAVFEERLRSLMAAGLREIWADNIYGIQLGDRLGLTVRGGFCLNITNSEAVDEYFNAGLESVTLSFELSMQRIHAISGRAAMGIVCYGRLPLMRLRNCPMRAGQGCAACKGHGSLTDRLGIEFPLECGERRFSTLLNSVPLHIADRELPQLDYYLLWFTRESVDTCRRVIDDFKLGRPAAGKRTGGLYYRELK